MHQSARLQSPAKFCEKYLWLQEESDENTKLVSGKSLMMGRDLREEVPIRGRGGHYGQ